MRFFVVVLNEGWTIYFACLGLFCKCFVNFDTSPLWNQPEEGGGGSYSVTYVIFHISKGSFSVWNEPLMYSVTNLVTTTPPKLLWVSEIIVTAVPLKHTTRRIVTRVASGTMPWAGGSQSGSSLVTQSVTACHCYWLEEHIREQHQVAGSTSRI